MTSLHERLKTSPAASAAADGTAEVVPQVHSRVGELLTEQHATDADAGRPRMPIEDERALSRKLIGDELARLASQALDAGRRPLDGRQEAEVAAAVFDRLHGLGRLQPLLDDPDIRDIHISGHARVWLERRDGTLSLIHI